MASQVDPGRGPVMLIGHATVGDFVIGSYERGSEIQLAELFSEPVIPLSDIDVDPWQHVALGHIHRRQQLGKRCWYAVNLIVLTFLMRGWTRRSLSFLSRITGEGAEVESIPAPARQLRRPSLLHKMPQSSISSQHCPGCRRNCVPHCVPPGSDMALSAEVRHVVEAVGGESHA